MKVGDLVYSTRRKGMRNIGTILGFSIDFLIHRYDTNEYRVLWQKSGRVSEKVSEEFLRKVS